MTRPKLFRACLPLLLDPVSLPPLASWWLRLCDNLCGRPRCRLAPVQPIAFEMSVKERRRGGRTWVRSRGSRREQGEGWNAIGDGTQFEKGLCREAAHHSSLWRRRSGPRAPSTSSLLGGGRSERGAQPRASLTFDLRWRVVSRWSEVQGPWRNGSGCSWRFIACSISESGSRLGWWSSACEPSPDLGLCPPGSRLV